jgi:hypothetical protein
MSKLMTDDERDPLLKEAGRAAAKFWGMASDLEGYQACKEYNESLRRAGVDGDAHDWIIGAGCRAKGVSGPERDSLAALTVRLRRR